MLLWTWEGEHIIFPVWGYYLKLCRRPWCVHQVTNLRAVSAQTSMNTAALITNQHTSVHWSPARLCEEGENHSQIMTLAVTSLLNHTKMCSHFSVDLRCEWATAEKTILHHLVFTGFIYCDFICTWSKLSQLHNTIVSINQSIIHSLLLFTYSNPLLLFHNYTKQSKIF